MTANQINYAKLQEERRKNLESERLTGQANEASQLQAKSAWSQAQTAILKQQEEARHNQEGERINWWTNRATLEESQRHNLESERQNLLSTNYLRDFQLKQGEALLRQAAASESQAWAAREQASASSRQAASREKELEVTRYNSLINAQNATTRENELAASIAAVNKQVAASMHATDVSGYNASVRNIIEAQDNLARQQETHRANVAQESISSRNANTAAKDAETRAKAQQTNEKNATTNRIRAVTGGIRDVSQAANNLSSLAKSILGVFK